MTSATQKRPGTVTLVVVLVWIVAILNIAGGISLLFKWIDLNDIPELDNAASYGTATAIGLIIFGLIAGGVAQGLSHGNQLARFLITLLMILRIIFDVIFVANVGSAALGTVILSVLFALAIMFLLWNSRASRFFKAA